MGVVHRTRWWRPKKTSCSQLARYPGPAVTTTLSAEAAGVPAEPCAASGTASGLTHTMATSSRHRRAQLIRSPLLTVLFPASAPGAFGTQRPRCPARRGHDFGELPAFGPLFQQRFDHPLRGLEAGRMDQQRAVETLLLVVR